MGAMDSETFTPFKIRRIDRETLIVLVLLAVAVLWRLVFFLEMSASPYGGTLSLDSEVYHQMALEVAAGQRTAESTFFQAPFYPWSLGRVYSLFGPSQTAAKLLQIALSVASCWLVYRIAGRCFDHAVALVALAFSSVYGMYVYFSNELLVVTLIVFLDLLGLEILLRASAGGRMILWGAAGAVFGVSAIARPTILPFVVAVCFWAVISGWRSGRIRATLLSMLVFVAGVAAPIAPVTLHNFLADGDLVLIAANGGFNFFIGNNPLSDGVTAVAPGVRADLRGAQSDQAQIAREGLGKADVTPKEMSDFWYERAKKYIWSEPAWALRHTAYKAFILCNGHEVSNNRVIEFVTRHSSIFSWATLRFWLILPLAAAGAVVGGGRRREKSLLVVFVVVYSATVVAFFVNARFRMPVVAVVIIFAAAAIVAWTGWLRTRPSDRHIGWRIAVSVVVALATAIAVRPLPALRVPAAQACFNEAEAYRMQGDFTNASRWYEQALDEFPGFCDAAYNLARIHSEILADPHRVIAILGPVVVECPGDQGIRLLLGRALCAVGRCDEGSEFLSAVGETESDLRSPKAFATDHG